MKCPDPREPMIEVPVLIKVQGRRCQCPSSRTDRWTAGAAFFLQPARRFRPLTDLMRPIHAGEGGLLYSSLPIQMLTSSRNTPTDTPRTMSAAGTCEHSGVSHLKLIAGVTRTPPWFL